MRVDGTPVVLNLTAHECLAPDRSLDLVRHSPAGFDWGYTGSGPAQLACALLLDYYNDESVAHQHYIQFRNAVVSQLVCTGPADCWHLTGDDIETALADCNEHHALSPDGGKPSASLSANWSAVSRTDRTIFQRRDIDHYVVLRDGSEEFGTNIDGAIEPDMDAIIERKDDIVESIREGAYDNVESNENIDFVEGHGVFEDSHELRVGDRTPSAENVVVNTGARPAKPSVDGLNDVPVHDSTDLLERDSVPESLAVIGGGYVGCEYGQMYSGSAPTSLSSSGEIAFFWRRTQR